MFIEVKHKINKITASFVQQETSDQCLHNSDSIHKHRSAEISNIPVNLH